MAERIDFERLNFHDIDILRGRVSLTPDEMDRLCDSLMQSVQDVAGINQFDENIKMLAQAVKKIIKNKGIYSLSRTSAAELNETLSELLDILLTD